MCPTSSRKSGSAEASAVKSSTTAVASSDPVDRGVEVRAGVLARGDVVPVPGGPALVVAADLMQLECLCISERLRQPDHRCRRLQPGGKVNDLDSAGSYGRDELVQHGHDGPPVCGCRPA